MRAALLLLLAVLAVLAGPAQAQDVLGGLREPGQGFARVVPGRSLEFPRDHGPHFDYRIEWWYLTANMTDADGRPWGLQWTLFRQGLSPGRAAPGWQSNQIWMAHAAITTPSGHFYEQRFARGGIGQAGVSDIDRDGYFDAWLDDWEWRAQTASMFPARLSFTVGDRNIGLSLESGGAPVANGDGGYSLKSSQGQASYYYSQPRIRVRGYVERAGGERVELAGRGWLDREWSSQALAPNQQGWDWFSLHLDDGNELMLYRLRHDDGEHWLSGTWIDAGGHARSLDRDAVRLEQLRVREVETGDGESRALPLEWRIRLSAPAREYRVRPLYDAQWMATSIPYWEGVVLVEDAAGKPAGVGYMELTGYR